MLDAGGADLVWLLLAIGGAVCLFAYGISLLVAGATDPVRRRLAEVDVGAGPATRARSTSAGSSAPLASYRHAEGDAERDSTQARLIQAGFRSPQSLRNFYG